VLVALVVVVAGAAAGVKYAGLPIPFFNEETARVTPQARVGPPPIPDPGPVELPRKAASAPPVLVIPDATARVEDAAPPGTVSGAGSAAAPPSPAAPPRPPVVPAAPGSAPPSPAPPGTPLGIEPSDDPRGSDTLLAEARSLLDENNAARAAPLFAAVLERQTNNNHAMEGLSRAYLALGDPRHAIDWAEKAVSRRQHRWEYRLLLGDAYQAAGQGDRAREEWQRALEIDSGNAQVLRRLNP
jgi:hypothetical protein